MKGQLWQHGMGLFVVPTSPLTSDANETQQPWSEARHARCR